LAELAAHAQRDWRDNDDAIMVFKSVGFALRDLIAAALVCNAATQSGK
jgi:ornithine cyclodeaminase/alanine dehydrogenase-like protein (mu-crystallin family)